MFALLDLAAERFHEGPVVIRQGLDLRGRHVLARDKDILVESHCLCVSSCKLHWERGYTRTRNARSCRNAPLTAPVPAP